MLFLALLVVVVVVVVVFFSGHTKASIFHPFATMSPPEPTAMKYKTTRGGITGASFQEALLSGYAPDGGLFVPEILPNFTPEVIRSWAGMSYPQLAKMILRQFVSPEELNDQELTGGLSVLGCCKLLAHQTHFLPH